MSVKNSVHWLSVAWGLESGMGRISIVPWRGIGATLALALFAILTTPAYADQGSLTNSGGTTSVSSGVTITSTVASPAGTLTINCPVTTTANCAGGSFAYASNDGTTSVNATFTSGTYVE